MVVIDVYVAYVKTTLTVDAWLHVQKPSSQLEKRLNDFQFLSATPHPAVLSLYWRATHGDENDIQQHGI